MVEVEHVRAHRTEKDEKEMSHFEKFVTEGNKNVDELSKAGAMLEEGLMAEARAKTVLQEREEVYAALQYAASFHCKEYISRHRKSLQKWLRKIQELHHDQCGHQQ